MGGVLHEGFNKLENWGRGLTFNARREDGECSTVCYHVNLIENVYLKKETS